MGFRLIDKRTWPRTEYFDHYMDVCRIRYSTTVNVDVTALKGQRLYPAMLWCLTKTVNEMEEFRMALSPEGPGVYDEVVPSYTLFNQEKKNFVSVWTEVTGSYEEFLAAYEEESTKYSTSTRFSPKGDRPENCYDVSMVPWFSFSQFHYDIQGDGTWLLPIFTMGKCFEESGRRMMPLAIQVHHAACDGYHIGQFVEKLQGWIDGF